MFGPGLQVYRDQFVNYFSLYKGFFDEEFPGLENCYSVELRREVDDFIPLIQIR